MKPLIVFTALMITAVSCFTFISDYELYMYEDNSLKEAATECAADAALCIDEAQYAAGRLCFDRTAAMSAATLYFEHYLENISVADVRSAVLTLSGSDDSGTWSQSITMEGRDITSAPALPHASGDPYITVALRLSTGDLFRLPALEVTELYRLSTYELNISL